jgi:hypothetical protein
MRKLPPSSDPTNCPAFRRREVRSRDMYMAATAAASSRLRARPAVRQYLRSSADATAAETSSAGCCAGRTQRLRGAQPRLCDRLVPVDEADCSTAPGIDTAALNDAARTTQPWGGQGRGGDGIIQRTRSLQRCTRRRGARAPARTLAVSGGRDRWGVKGAQGAYRGIVGSIPTLRDYYINIWLTRDSHRPRPEASRFHDPPRPRSRWRGPHGQISDIDYV